MNTRTLHLLDVEYLGCGPTLSADDLERVLDRYRPRVDWHEGDILIGAASHWTYLRIAFANVSRSMSNKRGKIRRGESYDPADFYEGDKGAEADRRRRHGR